MLAGGCGRLDGALIGAPGRPPSLGELLIPTQSTRPAFPQFNILPNGIYPSVRGQVPSHLCRNKPKENDFACLKQ